MNFHKLPATVTLLSLLLLFTNQHLCAQHFEISESKTAFRLINSDNLGIEFENTLASFNAMTIKSKEGQFTQITIPSYGHMTEVGSPKLPVLKKLVEVPYDCEYEITYNYQTNKTINLEDLKILHPLIPAQPPVSKSEDDPENRPFHVDETIYSTDRFFGTEPVRITNLGILRGVKLARLEISPFRYNPVTGELLILTGMSCRIEFKKSDQAKTEKEKARVFSPWHEALFGQVINHTSPQRDLIEVAPVTYIIVSDPMFQEALQPFIEWKIRKGFNVVEAYTDDPQVGSTTTSIKNYLEDFYNNPPDGYHPQSFVLFVGDVAQIPAFSGNAGNHVTDLYYCEYTGDIFPECFYGRFSANNLTELQPQIDKTLEYEQYAMPDPTFLDEVVMVAGHDYSHQLTWGNGQINYGTENYFNAAHDLFSHTYLQPEPAGGYYSELIRQNVSEGVSYANYTAHCGPSGWSDPSFNTGHIAALNNAHKYPLMVGNCCSSLEFQTTCFGEAVLRADLKGAVGYIGGSNSTYWDEDFWWGVGFENISANPPYNPENLGAYDRTFHDGAGITTADWFITQGQMPSAGNLAVSQSGSSREAYYWEIYHLMGDPALMIYFSQPPDIAANYDDLMPLASETFTIQTEPYAYAAISFEGILHGAVLADETGLAEMTLEPITTPGTADVIITKQNGKPFFGTVEVASPTGPYILFEEMTIDDGQGNANGMVDYGELIALDVTLKNLGSATGTNIQASISSSNEFITILSDSHDWPDIDPGQSVQQPGAFEIQVDNEVPDQQDVVINLEITDGNNVWSSQFSFTLQAPLLQPGNLTIDDASGGNGNGNLDPGEEANILVDIQNTGHSSITEVEAALTSASQWVDMTNGNYFVGEIEAGGSSEAVFTVFVDAQTPVGTTIPFDVVCGDGIYSGSQSYTCTVGLIIEDFESGNFGNFNWQFPADAPWIIDNNIGFQGLYAARSGDITDNQQSEMSLELDVVASGEISFAYKVSSESNYDFLRFYIDDTEAESWSGTTGWAETAFEVSAGMHTCKWVYDKDGSVSSGSDCAWIDGIVFPPVNTQPVLEVFDPEIDDSTTGNGNGIIDPGETAEVSVSVKNKGISTAVVVQGTLISNAAYLDFSQTSFSLGTLECGASENAVFDITVSESAPPGMMADLHFMAVSGEISTIKTFYLPVAFTNTEDFETGDFSQFNWEFTGDADWQISTVEPYEGQYSAVSGNVQHLEESGLEITVNAGTRNEVSFWHRVSSESGYDFLKFYVDGDEMDRWSGDRSWTFSSYSINQGEHTLAWVYEKDMSVSHYDDCAWLDLVTLPTDLNPAEPQANFIADQTMINPGETIQFYDVSSGIPDDYLWTFEGGSPSNSLEQNPQVTYQQAGSFAVTLEITNQLGSSEKTIEGYITAGGQTANQNVLIPQGWSGISTCIVPESGNVEELMDPILNDLVILQSMNGMYYPAMNINTINTWNVDEGYKIKMGNEVNIMFTGWEMTNTMLEISAGWSLIPVLSECGVSVLDLFSAFHDQITVVKDVAGTGVYWPQLNINTLGTLQPGKAYLVHATSDFEILFSPCGKSVSITGKKKNRPTVLPGIIPTPSTHTIAVHAEALSMIPASDHSFLSAYTNEGIICGAMSLNEQNTCLTVFADDALTAEKEGPENGEKIHFFLEDQELDIKTPLKAEFDPSLEDGGYFQENGLSRITSLKQSSNNIHSDQIRMIEVFPNPASDRVFIQNLQGACVIQLVNMHGEIIFSKETGANCKITLEVGHLGKGIYLLQISGNLLDFTKKIHIY